MHLQANLYDGSLWVCVGNEKMGSVFLCFCLVWVLCKPSLYKWPFDLLPLTYLKTKKRGNSHIGNFSEDEFLHM